MHVSDRRGHTHRRERPGHTHSERSWVRVENGNRTRDAPMLPATVLRLVKVTGMANPPKRQRTLCVCEAMVLRLYQELFGQRPTGVPYSCRGVPTTDGRADADDSYMPDPTGRTQ